MLGNINWVQESTTGKIITSDYGFYKYNYFIESFKPNGDTIKQMRNNFDGKGLVNDVSRFDNGDLLVSAEYDSPPIVPLPKDFFYTILRLNSNLDTLWTKNIGDSLFIQISPQCFTLNDYAYIIGVSGKDVSIIKLDGSGDIVWDKRIDIHLPDGANTVANILHDISINNDGIYLAGYSSPGYESFFVKLDLDGNLQFAKTIANARGRQLGLASTEASVYIYYTASNEIHFLNFNLQGDLQFAKYINYEPPYRGVAVLPENDTLLFLYAIEWKGINEISNSLFSKTHATKIVNCYEIDATDSISISDLGYNYVSQSFWSEKCNCYPKTPTLFYSNPVTITDTTLCETFLPPKPPIEGDAILTIYPNPSNGAFQFQLTNLVLEEGELIELLVYEMNGKLVQQSTFSTKTFLLNKEEELANGMYICVVKLRDQEFIRKLVVD